MNKEKVEKKVLKAVARIARNEITKNLYGWPPICMGISHQPKRPKKRENS